MNKLILIGNLTKDPEVKVTSTGKKMVKLSIAVGDGKTSDGKDLTQYFNCTAWERTAEILEMYVKKGHKICVIGRLQNRSWDKPDGTKGYATDVTITEIELLTSKLEAERINSQNANSNQGNYNNQEQAPQPQNRGKDNNQEDSEDDKLPEIDVNDINVSMPF